MKFSGPEQPQFQEPLVHSSKCHSLAIIMQFWIVRFFIVNFACMKWFQTSAKYITALFMNLL